MRQALVASMLLTLAMTSVPASAACYRCCDFPDEWACCAVISGPRFHNCIENANHSNPCIVFSSCPAERTVSVVFEPGLVSDVAKHDPKLAAVLARLNRTGGLSEDMYTTSFPSGPFSEADFYSLALNDAGVADDAASGDASVEEQALVYEFRVLFDGAVLGGVDVVVRGPESSQSHRYAFQAVPHDAENLEAGVVVSWEIFG